MLNILPECSRTFGVFSGYARNEKQNWINWNRNVVNIWKLARAGEVLSHEYTHKWWNFNVKSAPPHDRIGAKVCASLGKNRKLSINCKLRHTSALRTAAMRCTLLMMHIRWEKTHFVKKTIENIYCSSCSMCGKARIYEWREMSTQRKIQIYLTFTFRPIISAAFPLRLLRIS